MSLYYQDGTVALHHGDCLDVLGDLPDESVDAVVTDPPYGLEFMGRDWDRYTPGDFQHWCEQWATECLRVLKPGGHMVAFGGTRTFHRLTAGIEDAGFEIRDVLTWLYGSGFPKSMDISKAIDKRPGVIHHAAFGAALREAMTKKGYTNTFDVAEVVIGRRTGAVANWIKYQFPEARWWPRLRDLLDMDEERWGPVIAEAERQRTGQHKMGLATSTSGVGGSGEVGTDRFDVPATSEGAQWSGWGTALKPAWEPIVLARKPLAGTVARNVLTHGTGALNIDACRIGDEVLEAQFRGKTVMGTFRGAEGNATPQRTGRFPANVLIDDEAGAAIDAQTGVTRSRVGKPRVAAAGSSWGMTATGAEYDDEGGASRFFYSAKADSAERPVVDGVAHPTVKPLALMEWLIRLVTPPGGTVLEPFAGSGTTLEAAQYTGHRAVGVEKGDEYLPLIVHRLSRTDPRVKAPKPVEVHPDQIDMLALLEGPTS